LNSKKILGILLAACFILSVTIASVSAAPDHRGNAQGFGKVALGNVIKKSPFSGDMGKSNIEKRNWDNQKSRWDNDRKKWDNDRKGWNNKKHGNDYNKWYRLYLQWLNQYNSWNNKYSSWYNNNYNHYRGR
jgi:hypothetical protein